MIGLAIVGGRCIGYEVIRVVCVLCRVAIRGIWWGVVLSGVIIIVFLCVIIILLTVKLIH